MLEDKLYQDFVVPAYKKMKAIAEAERQRAEAERQRALIAENKAERLAAKLRELGISIED
jgi:hypothetical protein